MFCVLVQQRHVTFSTIMNMKKVPVGVVLAVVAAILLHWNWNYHLSVLINVVGLAEHVAYSIFPFDEVNDNHTMYFANLRMMYKYLPLPISFDGNISVETAIIAESSEGMRLESVALEFQFYRPKTTSTKEAKLPPVIVYFHGGGFVFGGFDSHAHITSELAAQTGFVVIAVNYRLAPENKFPAAHLDCLGSVKHIYYNAAKYGIDKNRIVVAGDSAGGNLAAVVAQHLPSFVKYQVVIYPCLPTANALSPSVINHYNSLMLSPRRLLWFYQRYFHSIYDFDDPLACPFRYKGHWNRIPPAMIITAEYDLLRDEGELYAAKLKLAGVNVTAIRYNNTVHAFAGVFWFTHGSKVIKDISAQLRAVV
jgi:acetyl esterase